jgi:hypothetical protein
LAQWTVGFFDCAKSLEAIGAASRIKVHSETDHSSLDASEPAGVGVVRRMECAKAIPVGV